MKLLVTRDGRCHVCQDTCAAYLVPGPGRGFMTRTDQLWWFREKFGGKHFIKPGDMKCLKQSLGMKARQNKWGRQRTYYRLSDATFPSPEQDVGSSSSSSSLCSGQLKSFVLRSQNAVKTVWVGNKHNVWDTAANILLSFDNLQHLFIHSYRWVRGVQMLNVQKLFNWQLCSAAVLQ